jgi:hypothetical protein
MDIKQNLLKEFNDLYPMLFKAHHSGRLIGNTMSEFEPYWTSGCFLELLTAAQSVEWPPLPEHINALKQGKIIWIF